MINMEPIQCIQSGVYQPRAYTTLCQGSFQPRPLRQLCCLNEASESELMGVIMPRYTTKRRNASLIKGETHKQHLKVSKPTTISHQQFHHTMFQSEV
jgi:hypothetical protein